MPLARTEKKLPPIGPRTSVGHGSRPNPVILSQSLGASLHVQTLRVACPCSVLGTLLISDVDVTSPKAAATPKTARSRVRIFFVSAAHSSCRREGLYLVNARSNAIVFDDTPRGLLLFVLQPSHRAVLAMSVFSCRSSDASCSEWTPPPVEPSRWRLTRPPEQ